MCEQSRKRVALFGALLSVLCAPAQADMALAQSRNCLSCHAIDKKVVGPAFKDIAARYANDKGAADRLTSKIVRGGGGSWGVVAMPANERVTAEEAKKLAAWVLSQK